MGAAWEKGFSQRDHWVAQFKSFPEHPVYRGVTPWLSERPGGGWSFTFTGCHLHRSNACAGYRRFLVNGILWSAGVDIPPAGAPVALDPNQLNRYLELRPQEK